MKHTTSPFNYVKTSVSFPKITNLSFDILRGEEQIERTCDDLLGWYSRSYCHYLSTFHGEHAEAKCNDDVNLDG
jgi:hypothetical protein